MVITRSNLETLVQEALPGSAVRASDLTGTEDHWALEIVWSGFDGMTLLQQHRRVMDVLQPHMEAGGSGAIHAVQIKTTTPAS